MPFVKAYTALPNTLIDDTVMHYTSKIVYAVLAFSQRKSGLIKMTVAELVDRTNLSEATVLQALNELEASKFIKRKRNWRFSYSIGQMVKASNTYKLCLDFTEGYTLISTSLLNLDITPAAFSVLLFLYRCAGRNGYAFPSIRYIAGILKEKAGKGLNMAKSTVLRALNKLVALQAIEKRPCNTREGDRSMNTYYMTDMVIKYASMKETSAPENSNFFHTTASNQGGGFIFGDTSRINNITRVSILRKREKVSTIYCTLHKYLDRFAGICAGIFSGIFRPRSKDIH